MPSPRRKSPSSRPPVPDALPALRPGIERDTLLMPWIVADAVLHEAARFLPAAVPPAWADWLDARAERCYARHGHFRRLVRRPGTVGRDTLHRFFRHWLASRLVRERRVPLRRLPREFCFGGAPVFTPPADKP